MSDEMAQKAEQDKQQQDEELKKAQEEFENNSIGVTVYSDLRNGQFARIPNKNCRFRWQVLGLLVYATLSEVASMIAATFRSELDQREAGKKKGLFGAR